MARTSMSLTERVSIYMTPEQAEKVRQAAQEVGLDVSGFIRMVVLREVVAK